ncbi:MAG: alpha-mannosidase [Armatimonadetes bacterium]|nr:alpha-mannosidase [Candidatus Hippobium faecium]
MLNKEKYLSQRAGINLVKETDGKIYRINTEIEFACGFAKALGKEKEWNEILEKACKKNQEITVGNIDAITAEIEDILAPIGEEAKNYTIHCVGHAHIDMNWMWSWPETVNAAHDTFYTINRIMDEYPEVKFSQSQISLYKAMEDYCPEIFEKIKNRINEGRWEITATSWVEGEKNCFSGESLFRHNLYSKKFIEEELGINPDDIKIDWSPDTFGHAEQIPSILNKAGITRYYRMRPHKGPIVFRWSSPDGSSVICFRETDPVWGYNGEINEHCYQCFNNYVKETGGSLKDFMYLYGWGDHGGGPTRVHIEQAKTLQTFPIYPNVVFSTTNEYFNAIESQLDKYDIPEYMGDINYIFEGCYSSQSNVKFANRISELEIPAAETMALIDRKIKGTPYPYDTIESAWQKCLFNHFHDIFPGSGVRATYNYAQGNFQETLAITSTIKTRALKTLAENISTSKLFDLTVARNIGDSVGAGVGDKKYIKSGYVINDNITCNTLAYDSYQPTLASQGGKDAEMICIYNPKPWVRSEMITVKIWNKDTGTDFVVIDEKGNKTPAQIIDYSDNYWGHKYHALIIEAKDIPALGYKTFAIDVDTDKEGFKTNAAFHTDKPSSGNSDDSASFVRVNNLSSIPFEIDTSNTYNIENEYLDITVDSSTGSLLSVIDKETGYDYVREGEGLGEIEYQIEQSNMMPAWCLSNIKYRQALDNGDSKIIHFGPNKVTVRTEFKIENSDVALETSLSRGSRNVDFKVLTRWMELGNEKKGIPTLRTYFYANINDGKARYETPFGYKEIEQSSQEVPALKWFDLSGQTGSGTNGITLTNKSKYGHACNDDTISLTLLRSSYNPDPYPELGDHEIEYSVNFHQGDFNVCNAVKLGENTNNPLISVSVPVQEGSLPASDSFAECLTENINISAIKASQNGEGIIIRLYELAHKDTVAKIKINGITDATEAFETDTLERPLSENSAKIENGILSVNVKAYSNTAVLIK